MAASLKDGHARTFGPQRSSDICDACLEREVSGTSCIDARFAGCRNNKGATMASTSRGRNQDRARVAASQDHEVAYEAKKENVSKDAVKKAVQSTGNSRKKVEAEIGRH
jgi:hypothetical protein